MSEDKKPEATAHPPRLTEEALAELERLEREATPVPWARVWIDLPRFGDRRFLAELRNAAPSLLAEVREARKLLSRALFLLESAAPLMMHSGKMGPAFRSLAAELRAAGVEPPP